MTNVLITGAGGQIGTELRLMLCETYGNDHVIASDIRKSDTVDTLLDVTNARDIEHMIKENNINTIFHMAAVLSATGEKQPELAWQVNMNGLWNVLESARKCGVKKVFFPSSIAVFGPDVPRKNCPQNVSLHPTTLYGINKVSGELLSQYYYEKYGLDVRSIRYPGLISYKAMPGGGTTDYAVEIFYEAIKSQHYTCFVRKDTRLPMMYMSDAIRATIDIMNAERKNLTVQGAYNIAAMHFSAEELVSEIQKHIPQFTCEYSPDERQAYADSWPDSVEDSHARKDWSWQPEYDLAAMVSDMITQISHKMKTPAT
ncbi:NAD-dependent epimerase/dehydratase family protein [Candidatus Uabimicrobium amorphum]|uniref:L-threonine 3-dehydrogenase n=1 Tax=Uabimicrobium amorphum TaxID=2596890 RepID=A0A5S9F3D0_UABAM|nr:NAD-dependent epimerase/dehydratase family protein [Candidatus Uabimicrobium amorphum]BBM84121.1 L-threonine 3-dehydrogenase [Candidatus Uabimicrobium amorphum]